MPIARLLRPVRAVAVAVALVGGLVSAGLAATPTAATTSTPALAVTVVGNHLVDGAGNVVRLLGVDRSGTEYACAQGWGIFDGPSDATSIAAMAAWHVNAVRVPLNEDCWLGINHLNASFSGDAYRSAIANYVSALHAAGVVAILDLHWNAPGASVASSQQVMADADHSPAFWASVASSFRNDRAVAFDLYNEPHDISWSCWRDGCTTAAGWQAAGMQSLVNAVRSTGATQPVLLGGLGWASDLSSWRAWQPNDPAGHAAASFHVYNFSDAHAVSYLGWAWNTAGCASGPSLVTSYGGTPTAFGAGLQSHLTAAAAPASVEILDGFGGLEGVPLGSGRAPVTTTSDAWPGWNIARGVAPLPNGAGGYVLDGWGGVHPFAVGASPLPPAASTSDHWVGWDISRGIAVLPNGTGGYVLDGWGGVHPFAVGTNATPAVATTSAYWAFNDIARAIALLPDSTGGYVLDGWGGVHPFAIGTNHLPPAVTLSASWPGWDIARSLVLLPDGTGGYVLDGWGGVHPFAVGSNRMAPAAALSTSWPYHDVARAIVLNAAGSGGYVVASSGVLSAFATGGSPMPVTPPAPALPQGSEARGIFITPGS